MNMNRLSVLAVCFAVGLTAIAEPADAKKKKKHKYASIETTEYSHPSGKGFPNGRPWQALDDELDRIKHKLYVIDDKVDDVLVDTGDILDDTTDILIGIGEIKDGIDDIDTDLDGIAEGIKGIAGDVSMLKNTLEVQVTVDTAGADDVNDAPIRVFVQVIRNGEGVTGMTADVFSFTHSFPDIPAGNEASYCGNDTCFAAGAAGTYMLELEGDWAAATYAGTLSAGYVEMTADGDIKSPGTAQVSFSIPVAPAP